MNTVYVSQDAIPLGLKWYPGDVVSLQWRVTPVDWSGTYVAKLRKYDDPASEEIATFTVTAVYDSDEEWTTFTVTLATAVPQGQYWWSCKQNGTLTRFSGLVLVDA
jgi:hypothetical protein